MKKTKSILIALSVVMFTSISSRVHAGDMFVEGALGITSAGESATTYGIEAGYFFIPMFEIGPYFNTFSTDNSVGIITSTADASHYGVRGTFNLGGLHAGLKFGTYSLTVSASVPGASFSASGSGVSMGPTVGYDLKIGPVSVGAQIDYQTGLEITQIFLVGKLWF